MSKTLLKESMEDEWHVPGDKKNSLDSDEEDDAGERNYEILADDDIEGQEEGGVGFDGEVQITPFNMHEEMEEGHFDVEGNYHWKKEGKVVRDNWLENIDWVKIRKQVGDVAVHSDSDTSSSGSSSSFDHIAVYEQMLHLMQPGESVAKALRRLGGSRSPSASERWRRKKAGASAGVDAVASTAHSKSSNQHSVTELTQLANLMLTRTGNMDIYQETYEDIHSMLQAAKKKDAGRSYENDALDMYADDFDQKEKERLSHKRERTDVCSSEVSNKRCKGEGEKTKTDGTSGSGASVTWEFKWKQEDNAVHGPHSTAQMLAWVQEGYFKEAVWVRRCGQDGPFYTSQRVDFELFLD